MSGSNERLPDLCFSICRFFQVVFILQAQPHPQSLFLFPIVFAARGLGRLSPRSALQRLLLLLLLPLRRRSGLRPLQGSKQTSNLQKKRRHGLVLDPSRYSIFPSAKDSVPRQIGCAKGRNVRLGIFVRCVVLFLSFFFRYRALSFQKEKREGLTRDSLEKITTVVRSTSGVWGGGGGQSPRSELQRLLRVGWRSGSLRPLQESKQARNLYFKNFKSLKGFIGSDLNEGVLYHPANVNDCQIS